MSFLQPGLIGGSSSWRFRIRPPPSREGVPQMPSTEGFMDPWTLGFLLQLRWLQNGWRQRTLLTDKHSARFPSKIWISLFQLR